MNTPLEIERKFIPESADAMWAALGPEVPAVNISQCYLVNTPEVVVRVRVENWLSDNRVRAILCVKKATDNPLVRSEDQFNIDFETAYNIMDPLRKEYVIRKSRYCIDGYDVDLFDGPLSGLIIVEREFNSVEEAQSFVPPSWLSREVTDELCWSNSNLIGKKYAAGYLVDYNSLS